MSDAAPIGHNNPPPTTAEEWTAYLKGRFATHEQRKEALLASYERFQAGYPTITDDVTAAKAGDLRAQIADLVKLAEAVHSQEKAPLLVATRAVDGFLRGFKTPLDNAITDIRGRQTAYLRLKEDEQRRELQRRAAEAAALAAERERKAMETMAPADLKTAVVEAQNADDAAKAARAGASASGRPPSHWPGCRGEHADRRDLRQPLPVPVLRPGERPPAQQLA